MHFAFVDVDNLGRSIENVIVRLGLKKTDLAQFNISKLIRQVVRSNLGERLDRVFVYYATPDNEDIPKEIDQFSNESGFILRTGRLTHKDNAKKTKQQGVDVMLAIEAMQNSYRGKMTQCSLFSLDGDFLPLVDELVANGTLVNVLSFANPHKGDVAPAFQRSADSFVQIKAPDIAAASGFWHETRSPRFANSYDFRGISTGLETIGDWVLKFEQRNEKCIVNAKNSDFYKSETRAFDNKEDALLYYRLV